MTIKITRRSAVLGVGGVMAMVGPSIAKWPDRPITLLVGVVPGGALDAIARIVAEGLSKRLGQQVIVEFKPGASGTVAAAHVARATPDGYTLLSMPGTHATTAAIYRTLAYRPVDDFSMIGMNVEYPFVMVTHADHPFATIAELIRAAQSRTTPLLYGTPGHGSTHHLAVELFAKMANVSLQHIPYRGGAPVISDLLGKRLDFLIDTPSMLLGLIREGRLRPLATSGKTRLFSLPDVPTISEAVKGYVVTSWQGLAGPAGLPGSLVNSLNTEIGEVLTDALVIVRLKALGNNPRAMSPDEFKARIAADIVKWTKIVSISNIARID
jgi:tripartite-type tricarboxylate transporter receptor subunit TctC